MIWHQLRHYMVEDVEQNYTGTWSLVPEMEEIQKQTNITHAQFEQKRAPYLVYDIKEVRKKKISMCRVQYGCIEEWKK